MNISLNMLLNLFSHVLYFFVIFINDLAEIKTSIFSVHFADDTNLFVAGKNLHELPEIMNIEMSNVSQ